MDDYGPRASRHTVMRLSHYAVLLTGLLLGGCSEDPVAVADQPVAEDLRPLYMASHPLTELEPDRYIVVLNGDRGNRTTAMRLAQQYADSTFHVFSSFPGFAGRLKPRAIEALRRTPAVGYIEQDRPVYLDDVDATAGWGLGRIDQRGWPSDGRYEYAYTGAGVNIYIVDSGIDVSHPDFGGRAKGAWSFSPLYPSVADCNGHGTAVASVAGGNEYGVARGATLWSVRGNDCNDWQWVSDWTAAIDWVASNHVKPAVMNLSIGVANWVDDIAPGSMNDAVKRARNNGVLVVTSAGNDDGPSCSYSPGNARDVLTVAAVGSDGNRAPFSNYGGCVDLFAPGVGISLAALSGGYSTGSGTSFSSPFVAGVGALWFEREPAASVDRAQEAVVQSGSWGKVGDRMGSPNLLLYSHLSAPILPVISGPEFVFYDGWSSWTASASGGDGPVSYDWFIHLAETDPQGLNRTLISTSSTASYEVDGCDGDYILTVEAQSANARKAVQHYVFNMATCW